jgi:hypothetical protein
MLLEPFPRFFFDLQAEPFGDALLHPAHQHGGGVHAFDACLLVSGEQQNPLVAKFAFQFQRVECVPPGAFDVFADDGGEPGQRGAGFGEQVGHPAVAGDAGGGERFPVVALGAVFEVDAAGFNVPVVPGDAPPCGEPFLAGGDLPAQRPQRVLQHQGGGAG